MKRIYTVLFIVLLIGCNKEVEDDVSQIPQDSTYLIEYFMESDSGLLEFNIRSSFFQKAVIGQWDTSFKCNGGWWVDFYATSYEGWLYTGIKIDGEVSWWGANMPETGIKFYLP